MPVDIGSLSQPDRQDFERRLSLYGLNSSALQEPLVVASSVRVSLAYGPNRESVRQPQVIKTQDIDAVKRMIGIDDRIAKSISPKVSLPGRIEIGRSSISAGGRAERDVGAGSYLASPGLAVGDPAAAATKLNQFDLASMDSETLKNVRVATKAFVRGNSELVASYKPIISQVIGSITIPIWPILKVTVASGAVLEFGPGVNVLVAYEVEIEPGGVVRSFGHLTINCTQLTRPRFRVTTTTTTTRGPFRAIFSDE